MFEDLWQIFNVGEHTCKCSVQQKEYTYSLPPQTSYWHDLHNCLPTFLFPSHSPSYSPLSHNAIGSHPTLPSSQLTPTNNTFLPGSQLSYSTDNPSLPSSNTPPLCSSHTTPPNSPHPCPEQVELSPCVQLQLVLST